MEDKGHSQIPPVKPTADSQSATGTVSLSFGLDPQSAKAYLIVPAGKRLQDLPKAPYFELY